MVSFLTPAIVAAGPTFKSMSHTHTRTHERTHARTHTHAHTFNHLQCFYAVLVVSNSALTDMVPYPAAPRVVPQVELPFDIDANLTLIHI